VEGLFLNEIFRFSESKIILTMANVADDHVGGFLVHLYSRRSDQSRWFALSQAGLFDSGGKLERGFKFIPMAVL
jgi:hypothetical protein